MNDDRLQAGRHHLHNGNRALDLGYPAEGRAFFESALLQFRGPELRLGEAHAYRGLARVELSAGNTDVAEAHAKAALQGYQDLVEFLHQIDDPMAVDEIRVEALEGEAAAWVALGEVYTRTGRSDGARLALDTAAARLEGLREGATAAAVWSALGRLALAEGRNKDAKNWFERALAVHREHEDDDGVVAGLLLLAQLHQLNGELERGQEALNEAREIARRLENLLFEGRVLVAMGGLALHRKNIQEARSYFEDAIPFARASGDVVREGLALVGLGAAASLDGDTLAKEPLFEGAHLLASIDHRPGVAAALQQIGLHARRESAPMVALAAGEGARRLFAYSDPVRGQGQALRVIVKALAALGAKDEALLAAFAREALAGEVQPNAVDVASWFRSRAKPKRVKKLRKVNLIELLERTEHAVERKLGSALRAVGFSARDLEDGRRAVELVEALMNARPAQPSVAVAAVLAIPTESVTDTSDDEPEDGLEVTDDQPSEDGAYQSLNDMYMALLEGEREP